VPTYGALMRMTLALFVLGIALVIGDVLLDTSAETEDRYHLWLAAGSIALIVAGARMVMALLRRRGGRDWATSPDVFTPPSYRGAILMLVVSLVAIVALWLAYGWALGELERAGIAAPESIDGPRP
jgi:hypothetical protein